MSMPVGMLSLGVAFPENVRTNDYWRRNYPELVAEAEERTLARVFGAGDGRPSNVFLEEMQPYLSDPFRGTVERRVLPERESVLDMEARAARDAMAAGGFGPGDIDLVIVASFLADQVGVGNAPRLARELGLECAAWNLETACSGAIVALRTASAMVRAGEHRRVLVVVSCSYSRAADVTDTLSWFLGDGAGAFVVGPVDDGYGWLGGASIHTGETCGTFSYELALEADGEPMVRMVASPSTGRVLAETATRYVRHCCLEATRAAGVALSDIDLFVFHTPVPWFATFAARVLEVDPDRTVSTHRWFANIGPALTTANLHYAAKRGRLRRGDRVLLQSIGSASSAAAAVMRWNAPALGPAAARTY